MLYKYFTDKNTLQTKKSNYTESESVRFNNIILIVNKKNGLRHEGVWN